MKILLIIFSIAFTTNAKAQFWKEKLSQVKESAKQKANQKLDNKVDQTLDKGVETTDSVVTGKKKIFKKNSKKSQNEEVAENHSSEESNASTTENANDVSTELVIKTNIKCSTGKMLLLSALQDTDGVASVSIDTDSGKVYISATDKTVYDAAIGIIRSNGFDADGKKSTNSKNNPCK
jgi:hypothetical protein